MDKVLYKPKILIRKSKISLIAKTIGCATAAVYNALAYRANSDLSKKIRETAINRFGGIKVEKYPELIEEM